MRIEFIPFPPASFPFRDLLVLEQLALEPPDRLCEIGVGSGETTARLARLCSEVTGLEISAPTVQALRYLQERHPNLNLVAADVTDASALRGHAGRFDWVLSCDTLEHVANPAGFFLGVATLLAPGGRFVITFPNEPADSMHGITRFDSPTQLMKLLSDAGLAGVRIGAARLTPHAERVAQAFGRKPLDWVRKLIAAGPMLAPRPDRNRAARATPPSPPQSFEQTRFFRTMRFWRPLSPVVNLYWYATLHLMAARGPTFRIDWDFTRTSFSHCQVLLTGQKPERLQAVA